VRGAQGNDARYINHSCDPNAYTKIVTVDGVKHVAIVAARAIAAGAEVFYDYKVRGPGPGLRRNLPHPRQMTRLALPAVPSLHQFSKGREQAAAQSGPSSQPGLLAHSLHAGTRLRVQGAPQQQQPGRVWRTTCSAGQARCYPNPVRVRAQFPLEPDEPPVPCACGARCCRGRLN